MSVTTTWLETLPLPTFEGYGIEPVDAILRTEMESGPARQRRRYTFTPTRFAVRWRFTDWQFALFESWYRYKGLEGAEWFGITLLGGLGMVEHEARFVGRGQAPYKATPQPGGKWIVESALEVRERPVLSEDALEIAVMEDIAGLLAAIAAMNVAVNTSLPANPW